MGTPKGKRVVKKRVAPNTPKGKRVVKKRVVARGKRPAPKGKRVVKKRVVAKGKRPAKRVAHVKIHMKRKALRRLGLHKNYSDASNGLDIHKPVTQMKARHVQYRNQLS